MASLCDSPTIPIPPGMSPQVLATDPVRSAEVAGLCYVNDNSPGIRRVRWGRGCKYVQPHGTVVREEETLQRMRALAIPPAWTDVWICQAAEALSKLDGFGSEAAAKRNINEAIAQVAKRLGNTKTICRKCTA